MSDTEQQLDVSAHPGAILRAAREEVPLSIEQVASSLHLRSTVVLSMERDLYDDFDSDVFLKGYFRSYCRLVGLHEERMVALLDVRLEKLKEARAEEKAVAEKVRILKARKKLAQQIVVVVALLGFGAGAVFYLLKPETKEIVVLGADKAASAVEYSQSASERSMASKETEELDSNAVASVLNEADGALAQGEVQNDLESSAKPEGIADELGSVTSDSNRTPIETLGTSSQGEPDAAIETVATDADAETYSLEPQSGIAELKKERKAQLTAQSGDSRVQTMSASQVVNKPNSADLDSAALVITFSGDCWFQLVNGEQRTPIARLQRAGDRVVYDGPRPYRLILGNARLAEVAYLGEEYDLSSHTRRNGRAEFVLD